jgi:hypothetical protein
MSLLFGKAEPVWEMDLLYGKGGCTRRPVCRKYVGQFMSRMVGRYVGDGAPFHRQIAAAVIDLRDLDLDRFMAEVRGIHKGASLRHARKAERSGYVCKRFMWKNFIPDIVEINTSKDVRSGGPMREAYRRGVEEMGGAPQELASLSDPACPVHCTYFWGVFKPWPGYTQGEVVTDEKLLGYIKFKRQGSLGIYTSILGHGDYLQEGIMYQLHYAIIRWVAENRGTRLQGLDWLLYGGAESGNEGLRQWKKRALFKPGYVVLRERPVIEASSGGEGSDAGDEGVPDEE